MNNARENMALGQLITNEVLDAGILYAMTAVPREMFVPEKLKHSAYADEDVDMGDKRFLLSPLSFARLLVMADITPACRVLCVGALNGYCAAVLSKLAAHVVATETTPALLQQMKGHLQALRIDNVDVQPVKVLTEGYAASAPYNAIILPGAIDFIPEELGAQLALNGRLAAIRHVAARPGVGGGLGKGLLVKRIHNQLHYREHFDASAPLIPGFERQSGFVF